MKQSPALTTIRRLVHLVPIPHPAGFRVDELKLSNWFGGGRIDEFPAFAAIARSPQPPAYNRLLLLRVPFRFTNYCQPAFLFVDKLHAFFFTEQFFRQIADFANSRIKFV